MTKEEILIFAVHFVVRANEMGMEYTDLAIHTDFVSVWVKNQRGMLYSYNLEWNDDTNMTKDSLRKMKAFLKRNQHKMCA